jgi:hypothetical protein
MAPSPKKSGLTLNTFDNHLMNGFDFCKRAYNLFEQIRKSPNGVEAAQTQGRDVNNVVVYDKQ